MLPHDKPAGLEKTKNSHITTTKTVVSCHANRCDITEKSRDNMLLKILQGAG